ncbi:MAG TPA: TonB-dependent receptor [Pyrinomonadaceae bacterium]|nr:TonB-dependent receptor [Pyrinomonadaceae bacterium]
MCGIPRQSFLQRASIFSLLTGLLLATCAVASAAQSATQNIRGIVVDQTGAPIAGARVTLFNQQTPIAKTDTGTDGKFLFSTVSAIELTISASAKGFAEVNKKWRTSDNAADLQIVLLPAAISEQVVISATRTETPLSDIAANIKVLPAADLNSTAALRVDDVLRQVPGFQLFRRSGSRTANPTSQGVSLRGIGASGASRSLVFLDGIPLNDPFGGWVYWSRAPRESLERIEVLRGGASNVYGSGALGGVINLLTKSTDTANLSFETSYGNEATADGSLFAGTSHGPWAASIAAETFKTNGYVIVAKNERGQIDQPVTSRNADLDFKLQFDASPFKVFAGASYFGESRQNGTPFQINRTHIRQLRLGADSDSRIGTFSIRAYGTSQAFDQNFSAIAIDRNSETPTRIQRVPVQVVGLSTQWSRAIGGKHQLTAGLDAREVRGASDELAFTQGRITSLLGAGGRERDAGVFLNDVFQVSSRFTIMAGARVDHWRNYFAHADTFPLSTRILSSRIFGDRSENAFSPQASFVYRTRGNVAVFGSFYRAFRAPTLNELYRSFRVGNILTLANADLRAEHLTGFEGGLNFTSPERRLMFRGTFFSSANNHSIANVTIATAPDLITRERRNLGSTRSQGVELETEIRASQYWSFSAGYIFANAVVTSFPVARALEGLSIPQVPRHSLAMQLRYTNPQKVSVALQTRVSSAQFDDDQNLFRLPGYFSADAIVSHRVSDNVELFVAAENLFNQRYVTGRTPNTTLGPPLLVRAGFRIHAHGK